MADVPDTPKPHETARQQLPQPVGTAPTVPAATGDIPPHLLTAFLYHLTRDLIPPRYMENVMAHLIAHPDQKGDNDLWNYAERMARRLLR